MTLDRARRRRRARPDDCRQRAVRPAGRGAGRGRACAITACSRRCARPHRPSARARHRRRRGQRRPHLSRAAGRRPHPRPALRGAERARRSGRPAAAQLQRRRHVADRPAVARPRRGDDQLHGRSGQRRGRDTHGDRAHGRLVARLHRQGRARRHRRGRREGRREIRLAGRCAGRHLEAREAAGGAAVAPAARPPRTPTSRRSSCSPQGRKARRRRWCSSNRNLLANARQVQARIALSPEDKLLNVLPVFHSYGLTGGTILPLLVGVRFFLYPSPLHYKLIPQTAAKIRPTIMFATDTFLTAYARTADDSDFESLRLVVAGAEAVRAETRRVWRERFGARHRRGLRHDRGVAGGRRQFRHAWPRRHGRPAAAGNAHADRAGRRHRRGRQAVGRRPQRHDGLHDGRPARRADPARERLARQRRRGGDRPRGLHPDPRPHQALRQDRRRDGVARRGRDAGAVAVAGGPPRRRLGARQAARRAHRAGDDRRRGRAQRAAPVRQEDGRRRADGAGRHRQGRRNAAARHRQDRLHLGAAHRHGDAGARCRGVRRLVARICLSSSLGPAGRRRAQARQTYCVGFRTPRRSPSASAGSTAAFAASSLARRV